jgi:DNA primase large subunit
VWLRRALALSLDRIKPESYEGAEAEAEAEGVTCPLTGEAAGHVLATDRVYALYEGAACNLAFCLRRRQRYAEVYIYRKSCIMVLLRVY